MNAPEIRVMPLQDLAPAGYNPRTISKKAAAGLRASIKRFGLVQPIVFNERSRHIVGGHQRVDAMRTLGETSAQVVVVDLPESEEKALNVTLNNPGVSGEFSKSIGALIGELKLSLPALDFDELRFDELADPPAVIEDEVPEPPKVAVTKPGDLWVLGRHRVLCGDATKGEDVGRVATGVWDGPFDLLLTDPPYNVGLEYGESVDDLKLEAEYRALLERVLSLFPARQGIVTIGRRRFEEGFWVGLPLKATACWTKTNAISRGRITQSSCWEPIVFFGEGWTRSRANDVLDFPIGRQQEVGDHPCPKPLKLWHELMCCAGGKNVADPFLGSGTTLIAAEQLDRVCYGLEIEPRYVDVIVQRWEALTGGKAKRA